MRIYSDISEIEFNKDTVVTIGAFDGLHVGHQKLLSTVRDKAREYDGRSFLVTFDPHPRTVVSSDYRIGLLTSLEEKLRLFEQFGIENVFVINFTKEFSQLDFRKFATDYLINPVGVRHIVLGYDHRFGKDRSGNEDNLRQLGDEHSFDVTVVGGIERNGEIISSTKIRKALEAGDLVTANGYLGYNYGFAGEVVKGAQRGRNLGFPTANITLLDKTKLIPAKGVYVVKCKIEGDEHKGVMNIGVRPTFDTKPELVIEAHLFDFNNSVYGTKVEVELLHRIREEKKFTSKEELINQIHQDKKEALEYLTN